MKNFIFLLLLMGAFACKRPDNSYAKLDPNVDAFLSFDKGSYWVYRDSITNDIDSMVVIDFRNTITTSAGDISYQEKCILIDQYKNGIKTKFRWMYRTMWPSTNYIWLGYLDTLDASGNFYKSFYKAATLASTSALYSAETYVGTYTYGTQIFDSVYRFNAKTLDGDTIIYFMRRRIGPISIESFLNGVDQFNYKLINYHLIPVP